MLKATICRISKAALVPNMTERLRMPSGQCTFQPPL